MAELVLEDEPIFIDVAASQQYPIRAIVSDFNQQLLILRQPSAVDVVSQQNDGPMQVQNETITFAKEADQDTSATANEKSTAQQIATDSCIKIQQRRVRCPECKRFTCETEEKMQRHIRKVHRGENPFQCYMCDYSTYNKVLFEEHIRIHQGIKPYKCSHCSYRSVSKKNTKKHELIHRPDNPLKCKDCDFIARNKKVYAHHQKVANHCTVKVEDTNDDADKELVCKNCPFVYTKISQLWAHQKSKKRCPVCKELLCTYALFFSHLVSEHNITSLPKHQAKEMLFKCGLCKWSSSNKPRILLHLIHHPNQVVDEDLIDTTILKLHGIME